MCILSTLLEPPCKIATAQQLPMFSQDAQSKEFIKVVDELVVSAEGDSELADGLKWIDMQSREKGITFYEMALIVLKKHMAERKAKEWLKEKMAA
jgi:hypothetical protein